MPTQVTNYKCPACGGPLQFDSKEQKLKCEYCASFYTPEDIEKLYEGKNEDAVSVSEKDDGSLTEEKASYAGINFNSEEASHLKAYGCPSCGAQLICDENTAATRCPYCDNPTVVPAQFSGSLKPDYIIPFKQSKEEAIKALKAFYNGKPFLPKAFKEHNHVEDIKGVYVPFFLYDGTADVDAVYDATRVNVYRQGDDEITETQHYNLIRRGKVSYDKVPADASSKMKDEFMDAVEPFNYADLVPFQMSFLPGYLADKYDVTAEENQDRADTRMKNSTVSEIRATTVGYSSSFPRKEIVQIRPEKCHYAFFPVWMLATRWNGQVYQFAMNGQTGKMIGDDLPLDKKKAVLTFLALTVLFALIIALILFMIGD